MAALMALTLASCEEQAPMAEDLIPDYLGAKTQRLDGDLIQIDAAMTKAQSPADVAAYADCAIARYAQGKDYEFARHVRTNVAEEAGIWRADAVYTVSLSRPRGIKTIDTQAKAEECAAMGIPTV